MVNRLLTSLSMQCLGLAPRFALYEEHLGEVSRQLALMHKCKDPKQWGNGNEFWDDYVRFTPRARVPS